MLSVDVRRRGCACVVSRILIMRHAHNLLSCASVGCLMLATSCAPRPDQELGRRISVAVEASDVSVVNVSEVAAFAWDRLFVFPPYTSSTQIEKELGFRWSESARIESYDTFVLLVFVDGDRVVRFIDQARDRGDFSDCHRAGGFSRAEAVFRFTKDASGWRRCALGAG
jgi:hypothetical protein